VSLPAGIPNPAAVPAEVRSTGGGHAGFRSILLPAAAFLGPFLLFLLELLFAKLILPSFGGSAAVWATCLVFFQCALLLGYLYAHVVTRRFTPKRQGLLHVALLILSAIFLPIAPRFLFNLQPTSKPVSSVLWLLTASIGLPFVLLSSTSPLLQAWHARRNGGGSPYYLFAISNLASLLALLSYPFLIEPRLTSHEQSQWWSGLYLIFIAVCSMVAWTACWGVTKKALEFGTTSTTLHPSVRDRLLWLALSACGSVLLLSVTNHLLEDVAPVALLWVIPLALYLLTFLMVFNRPSLYSRRLAVWLVVVALGSVAYSICDPFFTESVQVRVPFFSAGLFLCCWFCHGELASRKPAVEHLTTFYLMLSAGGALGAVIVGIVAPHVFDSILEFPIALVCVALVAAATQWRKGWMVRAFWLLSTVGLILVAARYEWLYKQDVIFAARNFYGAFRIKEFRDWLKRPYLTLYHGGIEHGAQFVDPPLSLMPTTYYARDSGIGIALDRCCTGPRRVGVIGLGAGTLAAYGKPGDSFRFYEINPMVLSIASDSFSYLRNTRAHTEVVQGDARVSLQGEAPQQFDVLAVDAFSGDAIPVHLLTREAFRLYLRHLKPNGILAIHTSNTYLNLPPVVQMLADDAGYPARILTNDDAIRTLTDSSDWMLITRNQQFLEDIVGTEIIEPVIVRGGLRLWTDDYNNLFRILRPAEFKHSN
jgi:predicted membrane-bound spermidine synthase